MCSKTQAKFMKELKVSFKGKSKSEVSGLPPNSYALLLGAIVLIGMKYEL